MAELYVSCGATAIDAALLSAERVCVGASVRAENDTLTRPGEDCVGKDYCHPTRDLRHSHICDKITCNRIKQAKTTVKLRIFILIAAVHANPCN